MERIAQFSFEFNHPLARKSDPATSHDAAEKSESFSAKHEARIFGAIADAGERGATAKEIASCTGLTDVQVNRRLGNMGERGVIARRFKIDAKHSKDFQARNGCSVWWKA